MSEQRSLPISVQPVISYPREAQVGKTYLMTVDLKLTEGTEWLFEEEEYPIYCMVDSEPLFRCEAVGEPAIVLHRFGGSYGAAEFLLTATHNEQIGELKVTLVNNWGVPIKLIKLENVEIKQTLKHLVEPIYHQVLQQRQDLLDNQHPQLATSQISTPQKDFFIR
jgi:hypothetical protein